MDVWQYWGGIGGRLRKDTLEFCWEYSRKPLELSADLENLPAVNEVLFTAQKKDPPWWGTWLTQPLLLDQKDQVNNSGFLNNVVWSLQSHMGTMTYQCSQWFTLDTCCCAQWISFSWLMQFSSWYNRSWRSWLAWEEILERSDKISQKWYSVAKKALFACFPPSKA